MASETGEGGKTSASQEGRFQAERYCGQPLNTLVRAYQDAVQKRDSLRFRLFPTKERQHLDGFIQRMAEELGRRTRDGLDLPEFASDQASSPLALPPPLSDQPRYELPSVDSVPRFVADGCSPPPKAPVEYEGPRVPFSTLLDEPMLPGKPSAGAPALGWVGPDYLFSGVTEPEFDPRKHRRVPGARGPLPEEMNGLASLFSGWTEDLRVLQKSAPPSSPLGSGAALPSGPPPPDFPEILLSPVSETGPDRRRQAGAARAPQPSVDALPPLALNWVEPSIPKIPLRARLKLAWRWVVDLLQYKPTQYQDWEA